jgi:hypothetical protein
MEEGYFADPNTPNHEKESAKRTLKRLRVLLIIWLLSFIATIIWFSISPNF